MRRIYITILVAFAVLIDPITATDASPTNAASDWTKTPCRGHNAVLFLTSSTDLHEGDALYLVVLSESSLVKFTLVADGPDGAATFNVREGGGPPFFKAVKIPELRRGRYRFALLNQEDRLHACQTFNVKRQRDRAKLVEFWPTLRSWSKAEENLYSAWIELLFDAPISERPSWKPLHQVLRDPTRNWLYNALGGNEDGPNESSAVVVEPDCADLPYYLRAYFAWKRRLPFAFRHCSRGSSKRPPKCGKLRRGLTTEVSETEETSETSSIERLSPERLGSRFSYFLRRSVSYVHSASGRTAPEDDLTDLYPVALDRRSLKPGTVYVDPYGHLLIIAKWVPQTAERGGTVYAVDGHPDLSVGRKQFWRGAFLFNADLKGGAGGFKAFRPLKIHEQTLTAVTNEELRQSREFVKFSDEQYRLGNDGFYDRMDEVINPSPRDVRAAYRERLNALYELMQERVDAVQAGEDYMRENQYQTVIMPHGAKIFETQGAWEDFSTPARDLRLLIAIDEVLNFPVKSARLAKRFLVPQGMSAPEMQKELVALYERFSLEHAIDYVKSDGTRQTLTMKEIVDRRPEFEVGYNPNDCVEIRWGATHQKELSSCTRRSNDEQRKRMAEYRPWFATRTRPPR